MPSLHLLAAFYHRHGADENVRAQIHFVDEPASQRAPPEIWERIARFIPRYHLRSWLFVSAFHRDIAVRLIFHTIDLYFGEDQDLNRGLDIFDRVKADQSFARRVKALRLHWAYEENDMFDLMTSKCLYAPPNCLFKWLTLYSKECSSLPYQRLSR